MICSIATSVVSSMVIVLGSRSTILRNTAVLPHSIWFLPRESLWSRVFLRFGTSVCAHSLTSKSLSMPLQTYGSFDGPARRSRTWTNHGLGRPAISRLCSSYAPGSYRTDKEVCRFGFRQFGPAGFAFPPQQNSFTCCAALFILRSELIFNRSWWFNSIGCCPLILTQCGKPLAERCYLFPRCRLFRCVCLQGKKSSGRILHKQTRNLQSIGHHRRYSP